MSGWIGSIVIPNSIASMGGLGGWVLDVENRDGHGVMAERERDRGLHIGWWVGLRLG